VWPGGCSPIRLYLDIEGDAANSFTYLVGVTICNGETTSHQSFWIDDQSQEELLLKHLLDLVSQFKDYRLYHYGSYETDWFKRLRKTAKNKNAVDALLRNAINVASVIWSKLYLPTHSHSLKAIGRYLGCLWTHPAASGLQSLVWRAKWEQSGDEALKQTLLAYNAEDCAALKRITDFLYAITSESRTPGEQQTETNEAPSVVDVQDLLAKRKHHQLGSNVFVLSEFDIVNKCAYFDYQREKVVARVGKSRKGKVSPTADESIRSTKRTSALK
jgi:hypothetical protein